MRRLLPLFIILLAGMSCAVRGQNAATAVKEPVAVVSLLTHKDSLFLSVAEGKKFLLHPVKAKQTLFSIARYYGLSLEELFEYNTHFRTDPTVSTACDFKCDPGQITDFAPIQTPSSTTILFVIRSNAGLE